MFKPTGLVIPFRRNWRQPKKLPKLLVAIFILIQLFYGINFGFFAAVTNTRLRVLGNIGSALNFLMIMMAFVYHYFSLSWEAVLFTIYYLCVFTTMIISKYTLYHFFQDLMMIDVKLNFEMKSCVGVKTLASLLFAIGFKIVMAVGIGLDIGYLDKGVIFLIMYVFYEIRNFLPVVLTYINILIFNVINLRLQFFKVSFEDSSLKIKEKAMIFKALADCLSKIRESQDTFVVMEFVANFIKCVVLVWGHLKLLKDVSNLLVIVLIYIDKMILIVLICLPAVFVELVAAQTDEIKFLANERLLTETDQNNKNELVRLLRYMEARPLTNKAWRLVPVDLRQPVSLLSISATYLLVLVQLTHLY